MTARIIIFILLVVLIILFGLVVVSHGQSTNVEWFQLVAEMQRRDSELDAEERRFVRQVINYLAASDDAVPTPDHRHWLLNIKRRLRIK